MCDPSVRGCNGACAGLMWRQVGKPRSDSQQEVGGGDERVEVTPCLDARRQVAVIDQYCPDGHVAWKGKRPDLA